MDKELCAHCDEEKNKGEMFWNYPLSAYVCGDCLHVLTEKCGKQYKPTKNKKEKKDVI